MKGVSLLEQVQQAHEDLFDIYRVKVRYRGLVIGGIPKTLDTALLMAEARLRKAEAPAEVVEKIKEETRKKMEEAERAFRAGPVKVASEDVITDEHPVTERSWVTFWQDDEGVYIESRTMKSALRECMSKLDLFTKTKGSKGTHDYGLFVEPPRLRFTRNGATLKAPDGFQDRAITVSTAQGKRTSIKREDFMDRPEMEFTLKVLRNGKIPKEALVKALALLQDAGHGAARSQGFGQLDILECVEVSE